MTRRSVVWAAALAGALACLCSGAVMEVLGALESTSSGETIRSRAFLATRRPPVVFAHDEHNQKAGLQDCAVCHHGGEGLRMDKTEATPGVPCSQCHKVEMPGGGTRLMLAYHRQCMGCHDQKSKGPLACGECHAVTK